MSGPRHPGHLAGRITLAVADRDHAALHAALQEATDGGARLWTDVVVQLAGLASLASAAAAPDTWRDDLGLVLHEMEFDDDGAG